VLVVQNIVNSLLAIKETSGSLLSIKKFKFPIGHWIEILLLIGIKVGKQISFLPLAAFLCLTFLLTLKLDDISFKITTIEYVYSIDW
jgi:hypothetical protein